MYSSIRLEPSVVTTVDYYHSLQLTVLYFYFYCVALMEHYHLSRGVLHFCCAAVIF